MIVLLFPNNTYHSHSWWGRFPARLVDACGRLGIQVRAYYRRLPPDIPDWVDSQTVTYEQLCDLRWCNCLLREISTTTRDQKNIIHLHGPPLLNSLWLSLLPHKKRYVSLFSDHNPAPVSHGFGQFVKRGVRKAMRRLSLYPDWIVPVSEYNAQCWRSLFGKRKIIPILNGVEIAQISVPAPLQEIPYRLLFVGRLMECKGLRLLLRAMKMMREKGVRAHLEIVGAGPERDFVESYIQREHLDDWVTFTGHLRDPSPAYKRSHVVIMPSTCQESFGLVSVEAQAHYLPCIYSNRGGLPETQVNGETGIMLESVTPEAIINAVYRLQSDPAAYERMRSQARENAERFSMERMVRDAVELYSRLLLH